MNVLVLACGICCLELSAVAQSFNIGPNGAQSSDDHFTVLSPTPVTVGKELSMAELPVAMRPASFCLTDRNRGRLGPFALADGTVIGSTPCAYTLRMFDYGQHFTLHAASDTNTVYGPFAATNGAAVALGKTVLQLVRFPPQLLVNLNHPDKINQSPLIGIAPCNTALIRELYGLRAKYVALANRVNYDTADAELAGVPRISHGYARRSASPVVRTSERDRQNALKGAELSAMTFLEKIFGQSFSIRSQAITGGSTFHFQMPAGDYVLCCMQRVKDPNAASLAGSVTAVWWTTFRFDGEHPLELALTQENAVTWRDIFRLSEAR